MMEITLSRLRAAWNALMLYSVESFLAVLVIIVGLPLVIAPGEVNPGSVTALFPAWLVFVWGFQFMTGGTLTLTGILAGAVRVERAGVSLIACGTAVYAFSVIVIVGWSAFITIFTFIMFFLAMVGRYITLGRLQKAINVIMKAETDEVS